MKKILLIEDNTEMRENTKEILELANYDVIAAKNGKEGIEFAQKEKPDLIICDIMMPEMDGYGVLHLLSKNDDTMNIPFIFLTAKAERSELRKGMEMGADDYITKPFDDLELLNAIETRLRKSEMIKKEFSRDAGGLNEFIASAKNMSDLKKLSDQQDIRICRKKEVIYREGFYPKGIYFVNKGKIKTYKVHDIGKELITGLYKDGDFFGYLSLLSESKYVDSAEALEDSEICFIPKDDFFSLIYKNAEVSRRFIKMLSDNLSEKEEQLIQLAYTTVRKRVADALVSLSNHFKKENDPKLSITISREDIANMAGTATETTIRILSDFKSEKLIETKGGTITILDVNKLAQLRY